MSTQNVIINGTAYPSVPAVEIPKSGTTGNAVFVEISDTEATSGDVLQGVKFYTADGTSTTGTIPAATLPTTTSTSKVGTTKATIGRSTTTRYINIPSGYVSESGSYTISPVTNGSATGKTALSATSATLTTGTNTLTLTKTGVNNTPTVVAGYVSGATTTTATMSLTASVTTKAAATYAVTTADQEIATGTYLTGKQTIKGVTGGKYTATSNQTDIDILNYSTLDVQVPSDLNLQSNKNATPSTSQVIVTPDTGYNGLAQVTVAAMTSGTAGTPTATKGAVSNNQISVTPSVTNTTGYITGGTKTGTAATVSASELVSGNFVVSAAGNNQNVVNYAYVNVPSGSATTPATTINATTTATLSTTTGLVSVNVSGSSSITPSVSGGWVSSGTAGTISVSGSSSLQLNTKAAATYTPGTTNQTITAGQYLVGTQTISGDADLVASNIKKDVNIFGVTGTYEGSSGGTVAPVGSVICMNTNTNPSTDLGGTWQLIEKKFTHWNINQANLSSDERFFIPNTDNFTLSSILLYRADNSFTIRLIGTNLVTLDDTAVEFGTFVPNNMGLSEWNYGLYLEGSTDGGNGIIQFEITQSDSPTLRSLDVVTKTSGGSIAANNTIHLTFTFIAPTSCMLDSECDRFYFEKTSSSDYTVTTGAKTITSNGTYNPASDSLDYYSQVTVNVQGGPTKMITGTFTGTTEDSVLTVNTGYTGNGYPIAMQVFVDAGIYNSNTTYYSTIKRYCVGMWCIYKNYPDTAPTYSGSGVANQTSCLSLYKSSTSSATTYTRTSSVTLGTYNTSNATASATACIRIKNKNTFTAYIAASGTSAYGFLSGTTYRYLIYYSE